MDTAPPLRAGRDWSSAGRRDSSFSTFVKGGGEADRSGRRAPAIRNHRFSAGGWEQRDEGGGFIAVLRFVQHGHIPAKELAAYGTRIEHQTHYGQNHHHINDDSRVASPAPHERDYDQQGLG